MLSRIWKWRRTHMNIFRHARSLEEQYGEGRQSFEAAMDRSEAAADRGDQREAWFWWKVANELVRIRQRRALASKVVASLRTEQTESSAVRLQGRRGHA